MTIHMIWATSADNFLGKDGTIPWHVPEDLKQFKAKTEGKTIVMGRKTWESLDGALPNRKHIIISKTLGDCEGAVVCRTPWEVIDNYPSIWVIGGRAVFDAFMPFADHIVKTDIAVDVAGDVRAPGMFPADWRKILDSGIKISTTGIGYRISEYLRND